MEGVAHPTQNSPVFAYLLHPLPIVWLVIPRAGVKGVDLKGAWNWLLGRGLPTGKELYAKMVDEADDMIMAMEEGREVDILQEVMRHSGLEAGER